MKHFRFPAVLGLSAVLLASFGCQSAPVRAPRSTQTLSLEPGKPAEAQIETVTAVRLVVPGPEPGSGLTWILASNNTRVLEQMGALKAVPAAPGGKPATEISFYALEPGKSVIRLFLVHADEAVATPAASCLATVRVED
jgi:hypothetical protein